MGNRTAALEESSGEASRTVYSANELNQYTAISENGAAAFVPQFDADGNQTLIKTETGIWTAIYNAENRPVSFTNEASGTVITCDYDSMGRRAIKKVTVNGALTLHQRYLYRGYLQIACIDLTRTAHPCLWLITWDPMHTIATRPLAIQKDGTWYTYGLDLTKNVCEVFGSTGYIATAYTYSPYGSVTATGSVSQPIQWSSEYKDNDLGLVCYNWRYYNTMEGKWNQKDFIFSQFNSYIYCNNMMNSIDFRGLSTILFAFFEDTDIHLSRLNLFYEDYNSKLNAEVKQIKRKAAIAKLQSMYCRQKMELFDWLRRQGFQIFWNNQVYTGTYKEYLRKIMQDTLTIKHIKLDTNETTDELRTKLNSYSHQYDKAIIMGHSGTPIYAMGSYIGESPFKIPRTNGESELVNQSYFGEQYSLMSCYMGDQEKRTWDEAYFNSSFVIDLQPIPGSLCQHVISCSISYEPLKLRTYTGEERIEQVSEYSRNLKVKSMDEGLETNDTPGSLFPDPFEGVSD